MPHTAGEKLGVRALTLIAVGACIGVGIFVTPGQVANALPHAGLIIAAWIAGGLAAFTGALTFAELGALHPEKGGVYAWLRKTYGPMAGFLYGWVTLLVINTGALATLALALIQYLGQLVPGIPPQWQLFLAICSIFLLTWLNVRGIRWSEGLASWLTFAKLLAMALIVLLGLYFAEGHAHWTAPLPDGWAAGFLGALSGVFFAAGGWHHASYVAGDAVHPEKTVPKAMLAGVGIVTLAYVTINLAYLSRLPLNEVQSSQQIAADAMGGISAFAAKAVAGIVVLSILGTVSIYSMSAPRVYQTMAEDGILFKALAKTHPVYGTPARAMWIQAAWASLLILGWQTLGNLIQYVVFMDIIWMVLAATSVFIWRKKAPDALRPVKCWGYPVVPLVYISISVAFLINALFRQPGQAIAGLVFLGIGVLVYVGITRKAETEQP